MSSRREDKTYYHRLSPKSQNTATILAGHIISRAIKVLNWSAFGILLATVCIVKLENITFAAIIVGIVVSVIMGVLYELRSEQSNFVKILFVVLYYIVMILTVLTLTVVDDIVSTSGDVLAINITALKWVPSSFIIAELFLIFLDYILAVTLQWNNESASKLLYVDSNDAVKNSLIVQGDDDNHPTFAENKRNKNAVVIYSDEDDDGLFSDMKKNLKRRDGPLFVI